jgi:hypothetical protein
MRKRFVSGAMPAIIAVAGDEAQLDDQRVGRSSVDAVVGLR